MGHAHNYKRHGMSTLFAAFDIANNAGTARIRPVAALHVKQALMEGSTDG